MIFGGYMVQQSTKKEAHLYFFIAFGLFLIILSLAPGKAGFSDWIQDFTITGRATSGTTNVSVTVVGANPVTILVFNNTISPTPTENSLTDITFYVTMADADGVNDLNDTSVRANFTYLGTGTRQNTSCLLMNDIDTFSANYSCTIRLWYFDAPGTWNITVAGSDIGNQSLIQNTTTIFQYNQLQAVVLSPGSLSFPTVSPNATNQTASNDPTLINNTGNYNVTSGNLRVTALNLHGQTDTSYYLPVANFSVDTDTGSFAECTGGTSMVNGTATGVTGAVLYRGNNSVGAGDTTSGQEQLYYCILRVPPTVVSQTYSTTGAGAWTVSIV